MYYDCLLLFALEEEFKNANKILSTYFDETIKVDEYNCMVYNFSNQIGEKFSVLSTIIGDMGLLEAYRTTNKILSKIDTNFIVVIGISGSLDDDVKLGDIHIPTSIEDYSYRSKIKGPTFEFAGKSKNIESNLIQNLRRIELTSLVDKLNEFKSMSIDKLKKELGNEIFESLTQKKFINSELNIAFGPLASGNTVISSRSFKNHLKKHKRDLLAVDMESYAIKVIADDHNINNTLFIRSISDLADERKKELDNISNGSGSVIRSWSIENATNFLTFIFKNIIEKKDLIKAPKYLDLVDQKESKGAIDELIKEQIGIIFAKHITERHFQLDYSDLDNSIKKFSELFHLISDIKSDDNSEFNASTFFEDLNSYIDVKKKNFPILLQGYPGTGKSTFLKSLFIQLYKFYSNKDFNKIPLYFDLHKYNKLEIADFSDERFLEKVKNAIKNDLNPLIKILNIDNSKEIILLIDGIDEYYRSLNDYYSIIEKLIVTNASKYKIIGYGIQEASIQKRKLQDTFDFNLNPSLRIKLNKIPQRHSDIDKFIDLFAKIVSEENKKTIASNLKKQIKIHKIRYIDIFILSLLIKHDEYFVKGDNIRLFNYFRKYCDEYIIEKKKSVRDGDIQKIAVLAFKYYKTNDIIPKDEIYANIGWDLIHKHSSVSDFLIAFHVIEFLKKISEGADLDIDNIDLVYTHNINRFIKQLMIENPYWEEKIFETIIKIYDNSKIAARTHFGYLLGRLNNSKLKEHAIAFLEKKRISEPINDIHNLNELLLLKRSISISLINLAHPYSADIYIRELIREPLMDNLNRGFHLEYYGDIKSDQGVSLAHRDNDLSIDFKYTFSILVNRLNDSINARTYHPLFEIELYTLCSLAIHRHVEGHLDEFKRDFILNIVKRVNNDNRAVSTTIRSYLHFVEFNLSKDKLSVLNIIEELYNLKDIEREGWLERGITNGESVADHIFGVLILAMFLLPKKLETFPDYDKEKIIKILLFHDLAEAFVGDKTKKTIEEINHESAVFKMILLHSTFDEIADDIMYYDEYFDEIEKQTSINGKIAYEIDKLENLFQLYIYNRKAQSTNSKYFKSDKERQLFLSKVEEFKNNLDQNLQNTTIGIRIKKFIREHFVQVVET